MKSVVGWVMLGILFFSSSVKADYYSIKDGIWEQTAAASCPWSKVSHASATCSCSPLCSPGGNFIINIKHNITSSCALLDFTGGATIRVLSGGSFTLNGGGTLAGTANIIVDAGGTMTINGNLAIEGNGSGLINGSLQVNGTITNSSSLGSNGLCGSGSITSSQPIIPGTICGATLLPIELLCLNVKQQPDGQLLHWETSSEKNNKLFEIEKSNNSIFFEKIGEHASKAYPSGNSSQILSYDFLDEELVAGYCYYRLKQIDIDEKINFSQIVTVYVNTLKNVSFVIYPNPNHSEFFIEFRGIPENELFLVQLIDNSGKIVYQLTPQQVQVINNKILVKPENMLQSGNYNIRLIIAGVAHHLKMLVE
jgi:hypothetical protein